jgi:general secretion pathway protein F
MVEAGEASGTLEIVLVRLADFTEQQVKLKNKIKVAMTYPVIM